MDEVFTAGLSLWKTMSTLKKKKEKRQRSSNRVFCLRHVVKKPCFSIVDLLLSGTAAPKICLQPEGKDTFFFMRYFISLTPKCGIQIHNDNTCPPFVQTIVAHLLLLLEEKLCKYRNEYIFSFTVRRKTALF